MNKNNKIQHTKKALLEALEKSLGVVTTACKQVGIDRTTFYRYYKEDLEFKKQVDVRSNVAIDFAESQLFKQIQSGNPTSTIFYLKTKAKKRGYVERQEIEMGGDIKSEIIEWKPSEKNQ
jgi:predicted DNA-binding transcriptional regulator AlpA